MRGGEASRRAAYANIRHMKRTTIFLDEGTERELQAASKRQRRPMASIVREAIERYVVENREKPGARLGFIAAGRSGHSDTAERHEAFLFDESRSLPPAQPPRKTTRRAASSKPGREHAASARRRR